MMPHRQNNSLQSILAFELEMSKDAREDDLRSTQEVCWEGK